MKPDEYIKHMMQAFPTMYIESGEHGILEDLLSRGVYWDKGGEINCKYEYEHKISEELAESFLLHTHSSDRKFITYYPIAIGDFNNKFNIPDNVTKEWLEKIREFCRNVIGVPEDMFDMLIETYSFNNYGEFYKNCLGYQQALKYKKNWQNWKKYILEELAVKYNWQEFFLTEEEKEINQRECMKELQKILDSVEN
jgi:hypothetical protein